jgi:hypothetical protein
LSSLHLGRESELYETRAIESASIAIVKNIFALSLCSEVVTYFNRFDGPRPYAIDLEWKGESLYIKQFFKCSSRCVPEISLAANSFWKRGETVTEMMKDLGGTASAMNVLVLES